MWLVAVHLTGRTRVVVEEASETFIDYPSKIFVRWLSSGSDGNWAHPCHTCTLVLGSPRHICTRTWAHLPHLRRNWAHPCHICAATRRPCHIRTGTGPALPTSALGPLHEELDAPSALPPAASYDITNGDAQLASYLAPPTTAAAGGCAQSDTDTLVWMSERSGYSPFATSRLDSL